MRKSNHLAKTLSNLIRHSKVEELDDFLIKNPNLVGNAFLQAAEENPEIFEFLENNFKFHPTRDGMYHLITNADLEYIKYIFKKYRINNEASYITAAFNSEDSKVIDYILSLPTITETKDHALQTAVEKGNEKWVKKLLEYKYLQEETLHRSLIIAAKKNNPEIVKLLLDAGASIERYGNTAFIEAYFRNNFKIAKMLFRLIQNPNSSTIQKLFTDALNDNNAAELVNSHNYISIERIGVFTKNPRFFPERGQGIIRGERAVKILYSFENIDDTVFVPTGFECLGIEDLPRYFRIQAKRDKLLKRLAKLDEINDELLDTIKDEEFISSKNLETLSRNFIVLDILRGDIKNKLALLK